MEAIPGAFEHAFGLGQLVGREAESDVEEENLCEGFIAVSLSKEDKERIRAPWASSLIVKSMAAPGILSRVFLFHFEKISGHFCLFRVFRDISVNTGQNSRFGQHEVCA